LFIAEKVINKLLSLSGDCETYSIRKYLPHIRSCSTIRLQG